MRTEPNQFEAVSIRLSINENQIWPKVAIPVIAPLTAKRMIEIAMRQRLIGAQEFDHLPEKAVEPFSVPA